MASEIQPIARKVIVIATYRTANLADVVAHLLAQRRAGYIQLHTGGNGKIEAVQWHENEKT